MTTATALRPTVSWTPALLDPAARAAAEEKAAQRARKPHMPLAVFQQRMAEYHEAVREERQLREQVSQARAIMDRYSNNPRQRVVPAKRHADFARQLLANILDKDLMVLSYIDFETLRQLVTNLACDLNSLEESLAAKRQASQEKSRRHAMNKVERAVRDRTYRDSMKGHNPSADSFGKKRKK